MVTALLPRLLHIFVTTHGAGGYLNKSQKIITFKSVTRDSRNDKNSIMFFDYVSFEFCSYEQNHY